MLFHAVVMVFYLIELKMAEVPRRVRLEFKLYIQQQWEPGMLSLISDRY